MDYIISVNSSWTDISGFQLSYVPSPQDVHWHIKDFLTLTNFWKCVFVLLILGNLKNVLLIWHLRIVNAYRFTLRTQRPKIQPCPEQIFQPLITTTHCPLMEIDLVNLHKSNSSYFTDIDIARTHFLCTFFAPAIEKFRGGTGAITGSKSPTFGAALGGVSCCFKRELKLLETYELWTRILSWDEKWFYIVTHFMRKGTVAPEKYSLYPEQNERNTSQKRFSNTSALTGDGKDKDGPVATALSRIVFKQGRRTISPALMLKLSGYLPVDSLDTAVVTATELMAKLADEQDDSAWIETERRRGLMIASTLSNNNQQALEMEFTAKEALGRHRDGTGIWGVVSTLAQLAHFKKEQVL